MLLPGTDVVSAFRKMQAVVTHSHGWYDHQMEPIVNQSTGSADAPSGANPCGLPEEFLLTVPLQP